MNFFARFLALTVSLLTGSMTASFATTTAGASGTQPPGSYTFTTVLTDDRFYSAGGYEGVLNIKLTSDGTLNGTYRSIDAGTIKIVTGGVHGDNVWLNVGYDGFHVDGSFVDGRIVGYTHLTTGADQFRFEAIPAAKQQ